MTSFCQRMLADRAFECGRPFHTELAPDETELIQRVSRDYWRTEVVPNALAVTVLLGLDLSLRNEGGFRFLGLPTFYMDFSKGCCVRLALQGEANSIRSSGCCALPIPWVNLDHTLG